MLTGQTWDIHPSIPGSGNDVISTQTARAESGGGLAPQAKHYDQNEGGVDVGWGNQQVPTLMSMKWSSE